MCMLYRIGLLSLLCLFFLVGKCLADAGPPQPAVDLEKIFAGGEPANVAELKAMERHQRELTEKVTACTVGIIVGPRTAAA